MWMFLIEFFGKWWYGQQEWDRRKSGHSGINENWVEPYFSHPLERRAWELRKKRFK
jgi:hypothetical protein